MTRPDEQGKRSGGPPRGQRRTHGGGRLHVGLVWERPERGKRGPAPALTREQIVRTAMEIADADGLEAISMRRIAQQLGVGAMSLYWHVASKEELLDFVYDEIFGEIEPPSPPTGDWRADTELLAHATRAVMLRHPWMVSIAGSHPVLGPNLLRHIEASLEVLEPLGLDPFLAMGIMGTIDITVIGFVVHELQHQAFYQARDITEAEMFESMEPYLNEQLATGQFPLFARVIESMPDNMGLNEQFQFGLDCLLDGIAARIEALRTGAS